MKNLYEFKEWFEKFREAVDLFRQDSLTPDQWKQLQAKIEKLDF